MSAWRKIFAVVFCIVSLIFIGTNLFLKNLDLEESGRPYRVEINRAALQIEQSGFESIHLSQYSFIDNITKFNGNFLDSDSDYTFREINGELYRFDYTVKNNTETSQIIIVVNIILIVISILIFGILFYIQTKILRPFQQFINIPYELSKGNLTPPIKESKGHFFGEFLWGVDMLRENIEQQKQRELELQKEKKMLLLSLSHDIKTPLSAIKLYAKALSKNLYSNKEKQQEIAESINKKADEIEGYISQIVTASHEDFLSIEVDNSEFYLSDLIQNISEYYNEKLALVKTKFIIGEYYNCLIFGNFNRSIEVLQNIIENALKYGDGKYIELIFPNNDEGILISIRNSGCTLEKSDLPYIFQSFWRGKNSDKVSGSGLGLYICRQLMHKMNGEIFAEITGEIIDVTTVFRRAS